MERHTLSVDTLLHFRVKYDQKYDILYLRPEPAKPAIAVDVAGEVWLQVDPESQEVVGVDIEDFAAYFLKRHPELAALWRTAQPSRLPWGRAGDMTAFVRGLGELLHDAVREQQARSPVS